MYKASWICSVERRYNVLVKSDLYNFLTTSVRWNDVKLTKSWRPCDSMLWTFFPSFFPSNQGPVNIDVYSGSKEDNVQGFLEQLPNKIQGVGKVTFIQLPYNVRKMNDVELTKGHFMILCHSINNRRLSITDVEDALYDTFLKKADETISKFPYFSIYLLLLYQGINKQEFKSD